MSINFIEYRSELCYASRFVHNAMQALRTPLLVDGFRAPSWLLSSAPDQFMLYASGKLFFERVWNEVSSALSIIDTLTEDLASSTSPMSQRLFDEVSLRQRKLFETFGLIAMLSRDEIYAPVRPAEPAKPELYFLHFHLTEFSGSSRHPKSNETGTLNQ